MTLEVLKVTQLSKSFGAKLVLNNLSFGLNRNERVALVGENGVGKTTLARIIAAQEAADAGQLWLAPYAQIGYLPQEITVPIGLPIGAYLERVAGLAELEAEMAMLEDRMAAGRLSDEEMKQALGRYGDLQEVFERRGGYDFETAVEKIFAGLNIGTLAMTRALSSLSGGEKTRVALAGLLLQAPELLILDEPTNHLDFAGIEWLENYLAGYHHALLLISHDRDFINRVATQIWEISAVTHELTIYHGNYDDYLDQREQQFLSALEAFHDQRDEMKRLRQLARTTAFSSGFTPTARQVDKFTLGFNKGRAARARSKTIRDAKQQLAVLEEEKLDNPNRVWRIGFEFDPLHLHSTEPVRLVNVVKSYGEKRLLSRATATLGKGDRAVLVAPNGSGKSTLLHMIAGEVDADGGQVVVMSGVKVGYLRQDEGLDDADALVLESFQQQSAGNERDLLRQLHRNGLFTGDRLAEKRVGDLSVGQRRKFTLAQIIASQANVLLLDEPTNHLDFATLEALEAALCEFSGAVLAVSHDRRFINHVATHIWRLVGGKIEVEVV